MTEILVLLNLVLYGDSGKPHFYNVRGGTH